jgi:alkanesulfonate monooxygenase SsuD/methylene tetrahydromethanopterin reductase-like flavin-dependent oxidoreductase (luciferase family)
MRLGLGLPNWLGNRIDAAAIVDWARLADDAGFVAVTAHDKPNSDTWDPLITLAAAAVATRRVRLLSASLLLPPRDEALVAKQALVLDQLSRGRLDLGVSVGAREDDFELLGRPMAGRGTRFEAQVRRILALWADARATAESGAGMGPAPVQDPHPPLWIGGYAPAAAQRAIALGDGYFFGSPGIDVVRARVPEIREAAAAAGRPAFPIAGLTYVLPSTDAAELEDGERLLTRYYGGLKKPFTELVPTGEPAAVIERLQAFEAAGLDTLHVLPVTRSIGPVERLARDVLPAFGAPEG